MIKYIGSKRVLIPKILELVRDIRGVRRVCDLFSGTARVGHALKRAGYYVIANDHNAYSATLARCYVAADAEKNRADAERLIAELDGLPGREGWFTEKYCRQSRYFRPENGARIESIRNEIAKKDLPLDLRAILLVALMEAADRVDSTTGVQMAYLKSWAPRAFRPLELRVPDILDGPGEAHQLDAEEAAASVEADLVYIDPPYNQHSYLGNYHVWETLTLWDDPEVYGVACKRLDCKVRKSDFNSKRRILGALENVLTNVRAPHVIVSFNDEGYVTPDEVTDMLARERSVRVHEIDHPRYVGARIGIHNQRGEKVGTPGRLRNRELLFVGSARESS